MRCTSFENYMWHIHVNKLLTTLKCSLIKFPVCLDIPAPIDLLMELWEFSYEAYVL